jgi:heme/copper-type cytochrome/quinol oxidase subunit 3
VETVALAVSGLLVGVAVAVGKNGAPRAWAAWATVLAVMALVVALVLLVRR